MKKFVLATCASLALIGGTVAVAPTASAASNATPGCVTKAEYKKAKKGMTQKKVHQIFGTKGKREARATSGGYVSEIRSYKACGSEYSAIAIAFDKKPHRSLKLSAKNAVWVD